MRLLVPPGVFRPLSDTWMLADVLRVATLPPRASVLDLCSGSGALAVAAARRGAREVTAVDISRRAVLAVRLNARANRVRVRALRGDLFAPVGRLRFDLIVSNPPYVPGEREGVPSADEVRRRRDASRAHAEARAIKASPAASEAAEPVRPPHPSSKKRRKKRR